MKHSLLLLTFSFLFTVTYGQAYKISGTVKDDKGQAIGFATVSLLVAADSSWKQSVQTDEEGVYAMEEVVADKYLLDIQMLGYDKVVTPVTVLKDVSDIDITLNRNSNAMEEVVIAGRKKRIETELGKTIVNISDDMKAGNSLLELLKDVPGVTVRADGSVSVQGKQGVTIMIDDKPVQMTGRDLGEYLKGISAENIKQIELMTQPSAKYDAEGNNGIILVKTDKTKKEGWNGNANARYSQGLYPFVNGSVQLHYRKKRLGLHIIPGGYYGISYAKNYRDRTAKDVNTGKAVATVSEDGFLKEEFHDKNLELGVDYDISEKTTLSASVRGVHHPNRQRDFYETEITDLVSNDRVNSVSENHHGFLRKNVEGNLFLKHEPDSSSDIVVHAYSFNESRDMFQKLESSNYDENGTPIASPYILNNTIPIQSSIYSAKADYTKNYNNGIKMEAGAKTSYVALDDENIFEELQNGQLVYDTTRSNHFVYDEQISAAYVSCSGQKGDWSAQGGVRIEHTYQKGHELTRDQEFEKNYTTLFPTAYVNYKVNDKNSVECNYGRRIKRPFYRELNPFTRVNNQYSASIGNPYLAPMFTHNIELKHNYRGRLITTVSYSIANGAMIREVSYDYVTNISNYSTTNNGRRREGALSAFFQQELNDWCSVTLNGSASYTQYEGRWNGQPVYGSMFSTYLGVDTQLHFKNGWNGHANGWYMSPMQVGAFNTAGGTFMVNADVSKTMFNDTTTIKLSVQDPFGWYHWPEFYNQPNVATTMDYEFNTRIMALALSYNFGRKQENKRIKGEIEEAGRM